MKSDFDRYFLAANSFEGFVSSFSDSYIAENGFRTYIIKGGPGTGKSSFMKFISLKAMDKGLKVHLCHCSSDPDSLDGIIIDEKKIVILDGTSPHIVEPKYPGVCENIIDLGAFWNSERLRENRIEIINATNINKALHKTTALYLKVCGEIARDTLKIANSYTKKDKALDLAKSIARKNIKPKEATGKDTVRYLSGITPKGIMSFPKTVTENFKNIIILEDKIGSFSGIVTDYIRKYALSSGYNTITLKSPFLPSLLIDHILIPELSLAVVSENKYMHFESDATRIHERRFTDISLKKEHKARLKFNENVKTKLLFSAIETLEKAKKSHDILEKYYIESMNFNELEKYTKSFCKELL